MVTAEQVEQAVKTAGITEIEHHDCSICGYMTRYIVKDGNLYFDPGCDCSRYGPAPYELREWSEASEWINMQNNGKARDRLMLAFGLSNNPSVASAAA